MAVTAPAFVTEAMPGAPEDHVTARAVSALPVPLFGTAVNWPDSPVFNVSDAGVTSSDARETGTSEVVVSPHATRASSATCSASRDEQKERREDGMAVWVRRDARGRALCGGAYESL